MRCTFLSALHWLIPIDMQNAHENSSLISIELPDNATTCVDEIGLQIALARVFDDALGGESNAVKPGIDRQAINVPFHEAHRPGTA